MPSDHEFEEFLRRFRPRPPRPLPIGPPHRVRTRVAVAAVLVLAALGGIRFLQVARVNRVPDPAGRFALLRAAKDDPGRLEKLLERESRRALPDVADRRGELRELASIGRDLAAIHGR